MIETQRTFRCWAACGLLQSKITNLKSEIDPLDTDRTHAISPTLKSGSHSPPRGKGGVSPDARKEYAMKKITRGAAALILGSALAASAVAQPPGTPPGPPPGTPPAAPPGGSPVVPPVTPPPAKPEVRPTGK